MPQEQGTSIAENLNIEFELEYPEIAFVHNSLNNAVYDTISLLHGYYNFTIEMVDGYLNRVVFTTILVILKVGIPIIDCNNTVVNVSIPSSLIPSYPNNNTFDKFDISLVASSMFGAGFLAIVILIKRKGI